MAQTSPAVLGPVEPSVRPHALAHARARVSMLGAGEDMDTINQALDEIGRLRLKCSEHRDGRLAALERVATLERRLQEVGDLAASSATGPAQLESLKMIEELCGFGA